MREPAAAGRFYPSDPEEIRETVEGYLRDAETEFVASGVVAPHAGYRYSGATAAYAFGALEDAEVFVVVGPDHRRVRDATCVSLEDWRTPLGEVRVDDELAEELSSAPGVRDDEAPHREEHSVEVILPFLQVAFDDPRVVPVVMGDQSYEAATGFADALRETVERNDRDVGVVASTDLTHYEPRSVAEERDASLLDTLERIDARGFHEKATAGSVCGAGPVTAVIRALEPSEARVLDYSTSAEATGDESSVVGYVAVGFS